MGKNANKRKSEAPKVVITPLLDAKGFINKCKVAAANSGWTSGYHADDNKYSNLKASFIIECQQLADIKNMQRKIGNAYPNMGTYTYTDGVVDYVLGLMMQPTLGVMPAEQKVIAMEYLSNRMMGMDDYIATKISKARLEELGVL
jgi:hypothetical protein